MSVLRARVQSVRTLTPATETAMFALFENYYDCVDRARFAHDLAAKDDVILLYDDSERVQGFSTIKNLALEIGDDSASRRHHYGVFSGDTVVARPYWGQRVLGRVFLRYLFKQRARHPLSPFWWLLISKGYRTYLMMANNFSEYYPRFDRETPSEARHVLDRFSSTLFGVDYHPDSGLIDFGESHGQLREGIAPLTPELLEHPKIAYFAKKNPSWQRGTELACLARMRWTLPFEYGLKAMRKQWNPRARPELALSKSG